MEHIDLLVNPNKIHIPKRNNNNISLEEFKSNISSKLNNYKFNLNKKFDTNDILDFLYFIQYHDSFEKNICDDCKKKIHDSLK